MSLYAAAYVRWVKNERKISRTYSNGTEIGFEKGKIYQKFCGERFRVIGIDLNDEYPIRAREVNTGRIRYFDVFGCVNHGKFSVDNLIPRRIISVGENDQ